VQAFYVVINSQLMENEFLGSTGQMN